jgi:hypothetical protein
MVGFVTTVPEVHSDCAASRDEQLKAVSPYRGGGEIQPKEDGNEVNEVA